MEAQSQGRRRVVRKPFADLTNTLASSKSSSSQILNKPRNPTVFSAVKKLLSDVRPKSSVTDGASVPPPPIAAVTPPRAPRLSSESGKGDRENVEPYSVYSRRRSAEKTLSKLNPTEEPLSYTEASKKRKSKGKEIAEPLSCPPVMKIKKIGEKINDDTGYNQPKACTAIPKKKQCRRSSNKESIDDASLQDYIAKQRAYFAEIDAFELSEEEVDSVDKPE